MSVDRSKAYTIRNIIISAAVIMSLFVIFTAFSIVSFADDEEGTSPEGAIATGYSGTVIWIVDNDHILHFNSGVLDDWGDSTPEWCNYSSEIKGVMFNGFVEAKTTHNMFCGIDVTGADFGFLDTSKVTDMSRMFYKSKGVYPSDDDGDNMHLSRLDTSNVTNMSEMFAYAKVDNFGSVTETLDLSKWDTGKVTDMSGMFKLLDFSQWGFKGYDLLGWDTSSVKDMSHMFESDAGIGWLYELDLSSFDTSSVENMSEMFTYCFTLKNLDLSNFDTSSVTNMERMFFGCDDLEVVDMSTFDTSNVQNANGMFEGCESLVTIDLSNMDLSGATSSSMFEGCDGLQTLKIGKWNPNVDQGDVTSISKFALFPVAMKDQASGIEYDASDYVPSINNRTYIAIYDAPDPEEEEESQPPAVKPVNPPKPRVNPITIYFNANGGTVSRKSVHVYTGTKFGTLPTPKYSNSDKYFTGWYTKKTGGKKISSSTTISYTKNTTLYAHWEARKSISKAKVTVAESTYNGKKRTPSVTVKLGSKTLKKGVDFEVSYSNNVKAGKKAMAKVTGTGKYKGSVSKKFTIKPLTLSKGNSTVTLSYKSCEYNGKTHKPTVTVKVNGTKLKKGTGFKVKYSRNKNIGTAKVTVKGKGNVKGSRTATFKITKAEQPIKLSTGSIKVFYKDLGNSAMVTVSGVKERAGLSVTSSRESVATIKKAGSSYKITYRGAGTTTISFKTTKATTHYKVTEKHFQVTVVDDRRTPKITLPKTSYTVLLEQAPFNLNAATDSDGSLSYVSNNTTVANVDRAGNVTICGKKGKAVITVSAEGTMKNKPVSATVTINVVDKTKGEQLVDYAKGFIGYPYVLNTHGPDTFDCSGFVYYVFKTKYGIELSTGSDAYWNNPGAFGTVVNEAEALPGDVVSWPGHVGIYIGNGQVVNALNPERGVCIIGVAEYQYQDGTKPPHKYIRIRGLY